MASVTGNVGGNVTGSVGSIAAGGINNAAFNSDVASTAYASNTLAQMLYKFFDNAFASFGTWSGYAFTSGGFLDRFLRLLLSPQANCLNIVAIRVSEECRVVVRSILGAYAGTAVVIPARIQAHLVKAIDL